MSFSTDNDRLRDYFEPAGKVVKATVIRLGKRRSAGYGFVTFETAQEAEKAVDKFNKTELDEREITVQVARPKAAPKSTTAKDTTATGGEANVSTGDAEETTTDTTSKPRRRRRSLTSRRPTTASTTRVFVANLPFATTDDELAALFEDFTIDTASIARLRNGRSKGYGFIDVADETEQQRIIENFKPVTLSEREISVKVAMVPVDVDAAADQVKQDEETVQ
ncbi:unnamed protein product [Absidia cylindrospora]